MTGPDLKFKRMSAGLAGSIVCRKLGMARSRLSDLERGYVIPSDTEAAKIAAAIDELVLVWAEISRAALGAGWPVDLASRSAAQTCGASAAGKLCSPDEAEQLLSTPSSEPIE